LRQHLTRSGEALFPHQHQALHRICTFLTQPVGSPIGDDVSGRKRGDWCEIVSATGTGKTRMFGHLAQGMGQRTLILTPRNLLNLQTKREFCEEIGIDPDEVGVYDSNQNRRQKQLALDKHYLITTYQSLPSLVRRGLLSPDPASPSYRHLVILDEAHAGQGYATSRLIRSFLDSCFVAGFTATDAGAHESLFAGQRPIFELGIVPAVEQGLLCQGVKTGVLDVQIDEDWLREFKRTTRGDFADEVVHRFARNPSVVKGAIDFHLTQDDEQLGTLHRLPTIFFTHGIDAAQLGADLFNRRAAELGVTARADFISGTMDQKERDEKLARFKRGEVQALWNDRVLEMGFDDANATVCYSLKPSLMSATPTQQLGRVTRRPKPDYAARFGQEKIALAINVRAPGMNPFLFGEVLGGRPAVYSTDHPPSQQKSERTKCPTPALPDVAVHLDYADMEMVLSQATSQRHEYPAKTDEWKHKNEFARKIGTTIENPPCRDLWERIEREYERFPSEPVVIDGHTIQCGNHTSSNGHQVFCMHTSEMDWFKTKLGLATGMKTVEWKHITEFAREIGTSFDNPAFRHLWKLIEQEYERCPSQPVVIDGHTIQCGNRQGYKKAVFCVHRSEAEWFKAKLGLATGKKTEEWAGHSEFAKLVHVAGKNEVYNRLWNQIEAEYRAAPDQPVVIEGHTVRCGIRQAGKHIFCLHADEADWFDSMMRRGIEVKTDDWLGKADTASALRARGQDFQALWAQLEEAYSANPEAPAIGGRLVTCGQRVVGNGTKFFCVHRAELPWMAQRLGKNLAHRSEDWLPRRMFARYIHVSTRARAFDALWDEIEAASLAASDEPMTIRGHRLQAQRMQSGSRQCLCMHVSEADWFRQELECCASSKSAKADANQNRYTWVDEVGGNSQKSIDPRPISPDSEHIRDRPDQSKCR
jgi:superfamily II DNA or RNA helicase